MKLYPSRGPQKAPAHHVGGGLLTQKLSFIFVIEKMSSVSGGQTITEHVTNKYKVMINHEPQELF